MAVDLYAHTNKLYIFYFLLISQNFASQDKLTKLTNDIYIIKFSVNINTRITEY